jgi:molecular chaperone GrpE (heat shock protein)
VSNYYYFGHHWAYFVENYVRFIFEQSGSLKLPLIKELEDGKVLVLVDDHYEDTACKLYGGELWKHNLSPCRDLDEVEELFGHLAWITRERDTRTSLRDTSVRLLVRIQSHDEKEFRLHFESIQQTIFSINTVGIRDVSVKAATISNEIDANLYDVLIFVSHFSPMIMQRWVKEQSDRSPSQIKLYYSYEPISVIDRVDSSKGIWIGDDHRTLPFLGTLAQIFHRYSQSPVLLIDKVSKGEMQQTRLLKVTEPFWPIYLFNQYELANHSLQVSQSTTSPAKLKPFILQLRLAHLPVLNPDLDDKRVSLEEALRKIQWQQSELERKKTELENESEHIKSLLRRVDFDLARKQPSSDEYLSSPIKHKPRKYLYLFFEKYYSGALSESFKWNIIQKLVLESSQKGLRDLRHAYCQFKINDPSTQLMKEIGFHLIGCGNGDQVENKPDEPLAGLQDADIVFYQDPDWHQLGYNLYIPDKYYLFPPVRPYDRVSSGENSRLFNDLVMQAVFAPEGIVSSMEAKQRIKNYQGKDDSNDDLCMIFRDPASEQLISIFLRREDFSPLDQVAQQKFNQAGLLVSSSYSNDFKSPIIGATTKFVSTQVQQSLTEHYNVELFYQSIHVFANSLIEKINDLMSQSPQQSTDEIFNIVTKFADQIRQAIVEDFDARRLESEISQSADTLTQEMSNLLDMTLKIRENELERKRDAAVRELKHKTDILDKEIKVLNADWERAQAQVSKSREELELKIDDGEKLVNTLQERINQIEQLTSQKAKNWEEFIDQVVSIVDKLQIEGNGQLLDATRRVDQSDQKLRQRHLDIISPILTNVNDLKQKLVSIANIFGGQTDAMRRTTKHLGQVTDILQGRFVSVSSGEFDPNSDFFVMQKEIDSLRQQLVDMRSKAETQRQYILNELQEARQQNEELEHSRQEIREFLIRSIKDKEELEKQILSKDHNIQTLTKEMEEKINNLNMKVNQMQENEDQLLLERKTLEMERIKLNTEYEHFEKSKKRYNKLINILQNQERFCSLANAADYIRWLRDISSSDLVQELETIHTQIRQLIIDIFEVQRIPIELGETQFNPQLGHSAVGTQWNPQFPENVILKVVQDGYTYFGNILREAHVVYNTSGL